MSIVVLGIAVFLTDALTAFMGWQSLDSWLTGRKGRVLLWNLALDIVIGVNTMGFVEAGWWMLLPSIAGSACGTLASFRFREDAS